MFFFSRLHSETSHSFKVGADVNCDAAPNVAGHKAKETYKSSVFRCGDWNEVARSTLGGSVTHRDFHNKPFASDESAETAPSR